METKKMDNTYNYQLLANAIVESAADDYFNLLAGFPISDIPEGCSYPTVKGLERFFHSDWYTILTNVDGDYLMEKLREKAESMKLIYTVAKEKGSHRWYVCKVGEERVRLSPGYTKKSKAIGKAAEMQGIELALYKKIRKRDNVDD